MSHKIFNDNLTFASIWKLRKTPWGCIRPQCFKMLVVLKPLDVLSLFAKKLKETWENRLLVVCV